MKDRELHKIVETIKLIKNTKNVGNNKINIEIKRKWFIKGFVDFYGLTQIKAKQNINFI